MKYFKALLTRSLEQTMIAKQGLGSSTIFLFLFRNSDSQKFTFLLHFSQ